MLGPRVGNSSGFNGNSGSNQSGSLDYGCCRSCHLLLRDPFIRCQVCSVNKSDEPVYICLQCFSKGLLLNNTFKGLLERDKLFGNFKVNKTETPMLEQKVANHKIIPQRTPLNLITENVFSWLIPRSNLSRLSSKSLLPLICASSSFAYFFIW